MIGDNALYRNSEYIESVISKYILNEVNLWEINLKF